MIDIFFILANSFLSGCNFALWLDRGDPTSLYSSIFSIFVAVLLIATL